MSAGDDLEALERIRESLVEDLAVEHRDPEVVRELRAILAQVDEAIASRIPNHLPEELEDVEYRRPRSTTPFDQVRASIVMAEGASNPAERQAALLAVRESRARLETHRLDVTPEMAIAISNGQPTSTARIDATLAHLEDLEHDLTEDYS